MENIMWGILCMFLAFITAMITAFIQMNMSGLTIIFVGAMILFRIEDLREDMRRW